MLKRNKIPRYILLFISLNVGQCIAQGRQQIEIVKNQHSDYQVILPLAPTKSEQKAANLLVTFIKATTGVSLQVLNEPIAGKPMAAMPGIYIGRTSMAEHLNLLRDSIMSSEGYLICTNNKNVLIIGGKGHGAEYGVYYFAEKFLQARMYDANPAEFVQKSKLELPSNLKISSIPAFIYRESYYPMSEDPAYLNWHGLHRFEDLWGIWGHSYNKLIPPSVYFKKHPEYYALVNGVRQPTQLCLSNPEVLKKVIDTLKIMMAENPDAIYWSVAPNDGGGYCSCDACKKVDREEGGHQGSLIRFVNKVADAFKDKKITTLAYEGTAAAPQKTHAQSNVIILISSIDIFREQPLRNANWPAAVLLRNQLKSWANKANQLFIWDYSVQFTNYLSPFPDLEVLADNLKYFKSQHVTGIFEQGSGDTYADAAELNSYLQAKLFWNPDQDVHDLITEFCNGYYGPGSAFVREYLIDRKTALQNSGKHLDIYGNPMIDSRGYLSTENMEHYQKLLYEAHLAVATDNKYSDRIKRLQLSLEYVALQQALFYGIDSGGFLQISKDLTTYIPKAGWQDRVDRFVMDCKQQGVKVLAEEGLSPDAYKDYWQKILSVPLPVNLALHAKVTLDNPFVEDYPAKGNQTLTDGMPGYKDFSYNWLCFYAADLSAIIDMGSIKNCGKISINFLDDPRHWIFLPVSVQVSVSQNGIDYKDLKPVAFNEGPEHSDIQIITASFSLPAASKLRFIKIKAINPKTLPVWQNNTSKKAMIAADEIRVTP